MALRKIRQDEDPVLRKKSRDVSEINGRILELLDDLTETMHQAEGVGLAAPQVGVLRRVCVVQVDETLYELINPVIVESEGDQFGAEGCLSVPGRTGDVHRPMKVKVESLDRQGNKVTYEGTELLARAFCHEIDHLDGILYTDKADRVYADSGIDDELDE